MLAQVALFMHLGVGPDEMDQLLIGNYAPGIGNQDDQQVKGSGADRNDVPIAPESAMGEVYLEVLKPVFALCFQ